MYVPGIKLSFLYLEQMASWLCFSYRVYAASYTLHISSNLLFHAWAQIGNAAYHTDMLYEELRRSIPHLSNLLQMAEEDKTKANAAGALSNLVRNSEKLCEDIVSKGAIQVRAHCNLIYSHSYLLPSQFHPLSFPIFFSYYIIHPIFHFYSLLRWR